MRPYAAAPARRATSGAAPASLPWAARAAAAPTTSTLSAPTLSVPTRSEAV